MRIVTNVLADVQHERFTRCAIREFIAGMLIFEEIGAAKTTAAFFDHAFAAMGQLDKEHVLIIGDSLSADVTGGSNYSIDTCWYNPQGKPNSLSVHVDYEIRDLQQLPAVTGKHAAQSQQK